MIVFDLLKTQSGDCAVEYEGFQYSYDHFGRLIHFRKHEIQSQCDELPQQLLVDEVDPFDHWITTLALSALRVTTAAYGINMPSMFESGEVHILSTTNPDSIVRITSFRDLQCSMLEHPSDALSFSGARIFFTSGTTGSAKAVRLDASNMHSRILTRLKTYPKKNRLLSLIPHLSTFGYQFQLGQWFAGGSVVLDRDYSHIFNAMSLGRIDYLVGAPNHFRHLVEESAARKLGKFDRVDEVIVGGGALSAQLYERLQSVFAARLKCQFGATETGTWTVNEIMGAEDLDFIGHTVEGTQISFDESAGKKYLKIKNSHTVAGYLDSLDSGHFKDGWFYPGDVIETGPDNKIKVLGRDADVVNVGGVKIDPRVVDNFLIEQDAVQDAACFWMTDEMGYPELWAATSVKHGSDIHKLYALLASRFSVPYLPKRLLPVAFIPRTYSGKPQRYLMAEKVKIIIQQISK
jgi:long-chain acyl-CoA synthetase